jgi:hypothetical protein
MAASAVSREWLGWVEHLARGEARVLDPRPDPDHFACLLEEQPGLLVPRRLAHSRMEELGGAAEAGAPRLNSQWLLSEAGEIPREIAPSDEWRGGFALESQPLVWVRDPEREFWNPFWLSRDFAARLAAARESGAWGSFAASERKALCAAGILLPQTRIGERGREFVRGKRDGFTRNGYCVVDGLIHPFLVGELRRYFRRLIRKGRVRLGDYQSAQRYVAHNEPVARFFHLQLTRTVSRLVGKEVKPSYVYFASYQQGARLKKHTDREQCEFSITFCLDYAPEPEGATPWPIHLDTIRGKVTVQQRLGEGLLYRGGELPHHRDHLPAGHTSTSIFFHYVPAEFTGPLS